MNIIHTSGTTYTLNFERGEEVVAGLLAFAKGENIRAAHLTGLGAASRATLAYYNLATKEYEKKTITEDIEILSLVGNIGVKEKNELVAHIHGVFGRRDLSTLGGHIFELVVSGAGELHLESFPGEIRRAYDAASGLTLMCPAEKSL